MISAKSFSSGMLLASSRPGADQRPHVTAAMDLIRRR